MKDERCENGLKIRRYRAAEANGLVEVVLKSIPEISAWDSWAHPGYGYEDAIEWVALARRLWREQIEFHFVVVDEKSARILGGAGIKRLDWDNRSAEIGYWIGTEFTRKGMGTRAARLCAAYAFEELEMQRVEFIIDVDNIASRRVAEKTGAVKEGVLRSRLIRDGAVRDACIYGLLSGEIKTL